MLQICVGHAAGDPLGGRLDKGSYSSIDEQFQVHYIGVPGCRSNASCNRYPCHQEQIVCSTLDMNVSVVGLAVCETEILHCQMFVKVVGI